MPQARPRVLLLLHEMTLTGAPLLVLRLFQSLRVSVSLQIVSADSGPLESAFGQLADVSVLSSQRSRRYVEARLGGRVVSRIMDAIQAWTTRRRLRAWGPTLTYVNSVFALPLVQQLGVDRVPTLLHVHEAGVALEGFEAAHPGLIQTVPDRYIAVSQAVVNALVTRYGVSLAKIVLIPPFVDVPEESGQLRLTPSETIQIGGMGNPHWTKGVELWLLAARDVATRLGEHRVHFTWIGVRDNDDRRQFRAMIEKLGLGQVVDLQPETPGPLSALSQCDMLAVSSWEESASMAALEAMAHEVPVICFAGSGGPPEIVGEAGVVVQTFSPSALADAIVGLAADALRRNAIRAAGRTRVAAMFSREAVVPAVFFEIWQMTSDWLVPAPWF